MFCPKCGAQLPDGSSFCTTCGANMNSTQTTSNVVYEDQFNQNSAQNSAQNTTQYSYQQQPYQNNVNENQIPSEYQPISMWGYFGYELLFSIPCVGFIFLIIFAFGGTSNINLKNFARSYFCFLIISLIICAILIAVCGVAGFSSLFY